MKNLIFVLFVSLVFVSCGTKETVKEPTASVEAKTVVAPDAKLDFSDPSRMSGNTNFGAFFIVMFRHGDYDMALKFTSKGSIEKFGKDKIKDTYANFPYNYTLHLADSKTKNDTITLSFSTNEYTMGKFKHMIVVVENDSCKLVLPDNLDDFMK